MIVQPYLMYEGRADEAIAFYKMALGAEQGMLMRYKDNPDAAAPGCAPLDGNKIMHAQITIGETIIMLSDGRCSGKTNFDGFSLSITVATEAEADKKFNGLVNGGTVTMPLTKTFFTPKFGMLQDKFGVHWMIMVNPK